MCTFPTCDFGRLNIATIFVQQFLQCLVCYVLNISTGFVTFFWDWVSFLFFVRQLKKFGLRREILVQFYRSAIESILTFSICVWFGGISQRQRSRLDRVVKTASKIVGSELTSLTAIYKDRSKKRACKIISDQTHPPIIFSIYYRQANAIDASVRKQIALEIVFTQVP